MNDFTIVNPTATLSSPQTYTVTGTTAGCSDTAIAVVGITSLPPVTANASSSTLCSGHNVALTAGGASTYSWSPGAVLNDSTIATPVGVLMNTTTFTVTGTANGCSAEATTAVTVTHTPDVTALATPSSICVGGTTTRSAGGAVSFVWHPGAGMLDSTSSNPVVSPIVPTTYTVTGTTSGCSATTTTHVSVGSSPVIMATASPYYVCTGGSTTLNANGGLAYQWHPEPV